MNFTLKHLRYFVAAAEHCSVTKAAEEVFVSQPSISSAIQHLEDITGLQLFIRHHAQGLTLTSNGWQYYRKAKRFLKEAESLSKFASCLHGEVGGELNIVGFPTFTSLLMPWVLKRFLSSYPDVSVQCDERHQKDLIEGIQNSKYEFGISYDMELPSGMEFEPLMSFPPYIVVSKDHRLADRHSISIKELAEEPMIMLDWPVSRDYFTSLFVSQGVKPVCAYRASSIGMVRGMVANGFGFSLLNTPIVSNISLDGSELVSVSLEEDLQPLTMGIIKLEQAQLTSTGEAFKEVLLEYVKSLITDSDKSSILKLKVS